MDALKAANLVAQEINIKLLGVSVLTSFNDDDLKKLGFEDQTQELVIRLSKIADEAKLYGIICSPLEVKIIKKIAPKLKCFTPGIRQNEEKNDQKRTLTPKEAFTNGSDWLVIGRPITKGNIKKNVKTLIDHLKR